MAAEKKWNLQSFPINQQLFGTTQSFIITCAGQNTFLDLNDTSIILTMTVTNLPAGATYSILRPSLAWVTQMQTTIQFNTDRGKEIKNYPGYIGRGVAGNMFEIMEYSRAKYDMLAPVEFLNATSGLTNTTFSALIPLKFLCDAAYDANMLNMDTLTFNMSFESLANVFAFSSGNPVMVVNRVDFKFPTITVTSREVIPKHIREIPNRQIYISQLSVDVGSNSVTSTISVPFPCSELFYFFLGRGSNYSFNPNPTSVVTSHQLTSMGSVYPLSSTYNASYQPGVIETGGVVRHYDELLSIMGKNAPEHNSTLTYTNWRDNFRIYSIEIGTEQTVGQTVNFQAQFDQLTTTPSDCVFVFLGRGHI